VCAPRSLPPHTKVGHTRHETYGVPHSRLLIALQRGKLKYFIRRIAIGIYSPSELAEEKSLKTAFDTNDIGFAAWTRLQVVLCTFTIYYDYNIQHISCMSLVWGWVADGG